MMLSATYDDLIMCPLKSQGIKNAGEGRVLQHFVYQITEYY